MVTPLGNTTRVPLLHQSAHLSTPLSLCYPLFVGYLNVHCLFYYGFFNFIHMIVSMVISYLSGLEQIHLDAIQVLWLYLYQ